MANRYTTQFVSGMEKKVVKLYGLVTIGAAGAPTLSAVNSKGVKSIARTGAGAYTVQLGTGAKMDVYNRLASMSAVFLAANPASPVMHLVSQSVATPSTGVIQIQFRDYAGVATDPGNGEILRLSIELLDSTAP